MNRDQWTLKMKREEARLLQSGSAGVGVAANSIFDRRAATRDRRAAKADRRGSGSRQTMSAMGSNNPSPADKYGACCEWGLPAKAQKR